MSGSKINAESLVNYDYWSNTELPEYHPNQIKLLATAPLIRSTGAQVQAYNYNANTIPLNYKSKKT